MAAAPSLGAIAQLGERYNGIVEVVGSIPSGSTSFKRPWPATVGAFVFGLAPIKTIAFEINANRHSRSVAKDASDPGVEWVSDHGRGTWLTGFARR